MLRTISLDLYKELSEKLPAALAVVNTFKSHGIDQLKNNLRQLLEYLNPPPVEPAANANQTEYLLAKFDWENSIQLQVQQYDFANFGRGNAYDIYLVHQSNHFSPTFF